MKNPICFFVYPEKDYNLPSKLFCRDTLKEVIDEYFNDISNIQKLINKKDEEDNDYKLIKILNYKYDSKNQSCSFNTNEYGKVIIKKYKDDNNYTIKDLEKAWEYGQLSVNYVDDNGFSEYEIFDDWFERFKKYLLK